MVVVVVSVNRPWTREIGGSSRLHPIKQGVRVTPQAGRQIVERVGFSHACGGDAIRGPAPQEKEHIPVGGLNPVDHEVPRSGPLVVKGPVLLECRRRVAHRIRRIQIVRIRRVGDERPERIDLAGGDSEIRAGNGSAFGAHQGQRGPRQMRADELRECRQVPRSIEVNQAVELDDHVREQGNRDASILKRRPGEIEVEPDPVEDAVVVVVDRIVEAVQRGARGMIPEPFFAGRAVPVGIDLEVIRLNRVRGADGLRSGEVTRNNVAVNDHRRTVGVDANMSRVRTEDAVRRIERAARIVLIPVGDRTAVDRAAEILRTVE